MLGYISQQVNILSLIKSMLDTGIKAEFDKRLSCSKRLWSMEGTVVNQRQSWEAKAH